MRKLFYGVSCVSTSGQLCDDTQGLTCSGVGTTCACPTGYFFNGTACRKIYLGFNFF